MAKGTNRTAPRYWRTLQRAPPLGVNPVDAEWLAKHKSVSLEEATAILQDYNDQCEVWVNDLYQVQVRAFDNQGLMHLNIRRCDGAPIHDWRHLQQIKNELLGPECEAVELHRFEVHGTGQRGQQTWSTSGIIQCEINETLQFAMKESFQQLTGGKAVYGRPGVGCSGPYDIDRIVIEQVKE